MPIVAATRSMVSKASAGCFAHHSSILAKLSLRTFLFASERLSSFNHLLKARTARDVGLFWTIHGLTVVLATNGEEGSKPVVPEVQDFENFERKLRGWVSTKG